MLVADPPCAPWSRAGKRQGLADGRDMLEPTVELIRLLRPRAYLVGNIPGLQDAPSWPVVQRLLGGLARDGYCVSDFAVLDAADYGVPQRRERPFWFGHLAGACIRWPATTHSDPEKLHNGSLWRDAGHLFLPVRPWVTCREALGHLPLADLGRPVRMKIRPNRNRTATEGKIGSDTTRCSSPDKPAATVVSHASSKGGQIIIPAKHRANTLDEPSQTMGAKVRNVGPQVLVCEPHHPPSRLDEPAMVVRAGSGGGANRALALDGAGEPRRNRTRDDRAPRTPQSERAAAPDAPSPTLDTREARAGSGNATLAWPWNQPATTVCADERLAPPGRRPASGIGSVMSNPNAIILSERAAAILQGFDEGWKFCGATKRSRWSQLGQAVPPAVAEAIGRAVREQLAATVRDCTEQSSTAAVASRGAR